MVVLNSSKIVSVEFKNCSSILSTGSSLYFPANNVTFKNSQILPKPLPKTSFKHFSNCYIIDYIDAGDGCWLRFLLMATLRYCRPMLYIEKSHQHNDVVTTIKKLVSS